MGRPLNTQAKDLTPTPVVQVRGNKGEFFQGVLKGHKTSDSKYKREDGSARPLHIFEFVIEDTDMALEIKDSTGEYVPADVRPGDIVAVFPPTRLANALLDAHEGDRIKFTYLGVGKAGRKGGKPHLYEANVL